jgi:hypothetical protein
MGPASSRERQMQLARPGPPVTPPPSGACRRLSLLPTTHTDPTLLIATMKVPSLALAALATASLATPTFALGDALVDLALWGAGALSSTPKTGRLPGGPPEGGWSWTNCGESEPFTPSCLMSLAWHLACRTLPYSLHEHPDRPRPGREDCRIHRPRSRRLTPAAPARLFRPPDRRRSGRVDQRLARSARAGQEPDGDRNRSRPLDRLGPSSHACASCKHRRLRAVPGQGSRSDRSWLMAYRHSVRRLSDRTGG